MERGHTRGLSSSSSSLREIEEEAPVGGEDREEEEKVYVAVGKEVKESKNNLLWVLHNPPRKEKLVIVHVHRPSQLIPMMGGKFPPSKLTNQQVKSHRQHEREIMNKSLDEYLLICSYAKVQAEKLVIEMDDIGKGLVELIAEHGITKLFMGAAADRNYSKKMKAPRSNTAKFVQQQADPSCKIWFVCKGNFICTREASLDGCGITQSSMSSLSSRSSQSEQLRSMSLPQGQGNRFTGLVQEHFRFRSRSVNSDLHGGNMAALAREVQVKTSTPQSRLNTEGSILDPWEGISRSSQNLDNSLFSASDEMLSNVGSLATPNDEDSEKGLMMLPSVQKSERDLQFSSPHDELEDFEIGNDIYDRLQHAIAEAGNLKLEAYEESRSRRKAEMDVVEAVRKVKASENLYAKEVIQRKDIEETLARERLELEKLKSQRDEVFEELEKSREEIKALELRIADSDCIVKDIEEELSKVQIILSSLRSEHEDLQREHEDAVREAEEWRRRNEEVTTSTHGPMNFSEFTYSELELATHNFDNSLKIGEGGYGSVYKGFLRHTLVAVKMLNAQSMQGRSEFHQEVNVLSRVRHPNLVTLIGACPEAWALVYEFVSNGSLEDRLVCQDDTPSLAWQVRIRIAAEICSALIFLHSNKPHSVVHGDLKPANILLDANFLSKLGDFGICRLLIQSNTTSTLYHHTNPKGTFVYMDPEFLATGELTPRSDVYSFGVIILRLLTGKPAFGIVKEVQEALGKGNLHEILDASAGEWPYIQAKQLAHLGLRCCEMNRRSRPDLAGEVWRVLEPMMKAASSSGSELSFGLAAEENRHIPSYFICPIFQEIMKDPHVAADGYTYEAEGIKGWLDSGHDTSPMTNLKLPHCELIPNYALRSAIQEWLQQQS